MSDTNSNKNTGAKAAKKKLTEEQVAIINAEGSIKINAVAGSGKTTTIIEYAAARPQNSRILYLAFNKSVKLEAGHKFQERWLDNVKVETAHSLAFRYIVTHSKYTVKAQGYKTHEIVELLGLTGNGEKHAEYIVAKAEMIFSTVHRAKGMEYDVVYLVDDFITEDKLEKQTTGNGEPPNVVKLNEEINLLYVAVTRAKNILNIPETLMPKGFPASPYIQIEKAKTEQPGTSKPGIKKPAAALLKEKAYTVATKREANKDAYQPWTPALDKELMEMAGKGTPISKMAEHFGRTKGAIHSRLKKLEYYSE